MTWVMSTPHHFETDIRGMGRGWGAGYLMLWVMWTQGRFLVDGRESGDRWVLSVTLPQLEWNPS